MGQVIELLDSLMADMLRKQFSLSAALMVFHSNKYLFLFIHGLHGIVYSPHQHFFVSVLSVFGGKNPKKIEERALPDLWL